LCMLWRLCALVAVCVLCVCGGGGEVRGVLACVSWRAWARVCSGVCVGVEQGTRMRASTSSSRPVFFFVAVYWTWYACGSPRVFHGQYREGGTSRLCHTRHRNAACLGVSCPPPSVPCSLPPSRRFSKSMPVQAPAVLAAIEADSAGKPRPARDPLSPLTPLTPTLGAWRALVPRLWACVGRAPLVFGHTPLWVFFPLKWCACLSMRVYLVMLSR
jgi:hypothetical protein